MFWVEGPAQGSKGPKTMATSFCLAPGSFSFALDRTKYGISCSDELVPVQKLILVSWCVNVEYLFLNLVLFVCCPRHWHGHWPAEVLAPFGH